ncbi:DUF445 domain-containing protein [Corynebacterium pyruviciproducens]|uniref:DUF445 domain-containing protein n=1 Tax=Corynebacterium pyruviciproducens TaxID=598660 RepID=UPI0023F24E54|nr:DUF445 family protein [Corynebacterium pyruviciproducens]
MSTMATMPSLPVPGPSPEVEAERRKALRKHKAIATGLLLVATVIYLLCRYWQVHTAPDSPQWVGFVRAAAEAGMIGGLADWFAVTALFRHPLGLKIPHTAIVKNKKDQLGGALSQFVGENFLNAELIVAKVREAGIPNRIGQWLSDPQHARAVSREAGTLGAKVLTEVPQDDAQALIRTLIIDRAAEPEWGPPMGRVLQQLIDDGKTEPIIEEVAQWLHRKTYESESFITSLIDDRAPAWAPEFANRLVGDKVYREAVKWTADVARDTHHPARDAVRRVIAQFAIDLQGDEKTMARIEEFKAGILGSTAVKEIPVVLWKNAVEALTSALTDETSILRVRFAEFVEQQGRNLLDDAERRNQLDEKIQKAARFLANNYAPEITAIISETVERWDAEEASDKIELMVGKDLQYIRLNGTIVGALAGLAIYTVSFVLFGG